MILHAIIEKKKMKKIHTKYIYKFKKKQLGEYSRQLKKYIP